MKFIWKYTIGPYYDQIFGVPGGKLLCVQAQNGSICLWFEVDDVASYVTKRFSVYSTGQGLPDDPGKYVGTVQIGDMVYHVYEKI